jgi:hypothetical protein
MRLNPKVLLILSEHSIKSDRIEHEVRKPQEQEMVKREIESTDRQIDTLVYELYGLTEDAIKIIDGG